jgi:hypothetical protein
MWRDWGTQGMDASDTNIHGMIGRNSVTGRPQTAAEALVGAETIINQQSKCGRPGNALHTVQDLEFKNHRGQQWKGLAADPLAALTHYFYDASPDGEDLANAYKASREYIRDYLRSQSQQGR